MSIDPSPVAPAPLDQSEKARLVRLERTVDRAVEVAGKIAGEALATIRDEKLYRATHTTFEAYVTERFGFSVRTAQRMIAAASAPDPVGELVEGSRQGVANPQPREPKIENTPPGPFDEPEQQPLPAEYQPIAADAGRLWGVVSMTPCTGRLWVDFEGGFGKESPTTGTRVLVAWER